MKIFTFIFLTKVSPLYSNYFPSMKFHIPTENIHLEGTVSQIFYVGPRFYFMKSRKIFMKR